MFLLLLAFGALRSCEPLHLFVGDISYDFLRGTGALVSLWHPALGAVPWGDGRWPNRRAYLVQEFGLRPRNEIKGHQRAGWKNLLLEESVPPYGQRSRVYWVVPEAGMLFWHLHAAYVSHVRPQTDTHPYYFSSLWGDAYAAPWTLDAAGDTFNRAVHSIGLEPASARGLCMHALRHRVAHWMRLGGVAPAHRQVVLHHQSVESQEVYGRPEAGDVAEALLAATGPAGPPGGGSVGYADLFPVHERSSRLDEIGRELARTFLGRPT